MNYNNGTTKQSKAISTLGLNATLIGFSYASVETIWSIFIFSFFPNESNVGFISAIFSFACLLSLMFAFPLFKKFTPQKLLYASVGFNAIIFALFAHISSPSLFVFFGIINALLMGVRIQAFGVLLRHNSSQKRINHDENHMYLLANFGFIIGPLISGYVANSFSVKAVMVISSLALLLSVYSITYNQNSFRKEKKNTEIEINPIQNITKFFRNKKRFLAYCLSGGLEVWWSISYIFLPVIMIEEYGFSIADVGVFLFLIVIPAMIIEFFMQKKEGKHLKRKMGRGYLFITAMALIAGLTGNIYIILSAFIIGSFGIGFIEPTVESYFFSVTKEKESKRYYGSFMTAKQVGAFIGKMLIASILLIFPLQMSIIAIGIIMFTLGIWSLKSK